jgi:UDP-N-acetylmuramoyl-L-alanyl-D-glutamate--2,6-diaminopimelate ligase
MLRTIKKIIPKKIFKALSPIYHFLLAYTGAIIYRFPSRKLFVIAITGTKGKSSTVEILNAILEEAGYKTAVTGTIRFKIGDKSWPNLYKMSMPGRFFIQKFLRNALDAKCTHVIMEITSEGAKQYRNKGIDLDALIFTNLSPEHIESHGSFEKYRDAKRSIGWSLVKSSKKEKWCVANKDDKESQLYLSLPVTHTLPFSLSKAEPYNLEKNSLSFTYKRKEINAPLTGLFNIYNILGAVVCAEALGVSLETITTALKNIETPKGRVERINEGQDFEVIVDYAHTVDSLEKLYQAFPDQKKICVIGNTGGGRDTWKRKVMGAVADKYCDEIILTDEDPYDDDPMSIVEDMQKGITNKPNRVIMNRREAIATAISEAQKDAVILITGKGTDPYIMRANGEKEPWSDSGVAKEELKKFLRAV